VSFNMNINRNDVLFDIYVWNNAWGYTYKGHLIFKDGKVYEYTLSKEDGFNPSLQVKITRAIHTMKLSIDIMSTLESLFEPLKNEGGGDNSGGCKENKKWNGADIPHILYYGYNDQYHPIRLRESGEKTCIYNNVELDKQTDRLISLLKTCLTPVEELTCDYCGKEGANRLHLLNGGEIQVFCNEKCLKEKYHRSQM
jgi:hypothetical protein